MFFFFFFFFQAEDGIRDYDVTGVQTCALPISVDMETLAVAQVAKEHKLKFMAIRVISDDMSEDLPPEILSVLGDTGAVRVGAALSSFVKRPSSFKDMLHLRQNANRAAKNLAVFLDGVVHQLCGE